MSTDKQRINFYADDDVYAWYESLPKGQRAKLFNDAIRRFIEGAPRPLDARLDEIERRLSVVETFFTVTKQAPPWMTLTSDVNKQQMYAKQAMPPGKEDPR